MAAVKRRHVLHHCVVIFFWSSGIWSVCCLHLSSPHELGGVSDVISFITINKQLEFNLDFYFPIQAMIPEDHPFSQIYLLKY